jgi:D-alanyl-D-alanine carboxypeptidase/D-alanyl-D-alanine-endopeptidase (penicillin-binding protein 4)
MPVASRFLSLTVIVLSCLLIFAPAMAAGRAQELVSRGGYAVTTNVRLLESRALDTAFVPASTIKLVTGLAALAILGPDYRFTTTFFVEGDTLYIRGSGDPGLTSATVAAIAADLARLGLAAVGDIALDADAFALSGKADGTEDSANPYDTANSALAVNYNAVAITVAADGRISSGEAETPLLPIMTEILPSARATMMGLVIGAFSLGRAVGALLAPLFYIYGFRVNTFATILFNLIALYALTRIQVKSEEKNNFSKS